mgnify:CR=1 FL=1
MIYDVDENRGNPARPSCWVSCMVDEELYKSTQHAWEWDDPAVSLFPQ